MNNNNSNNNNNPLRNSQKKERLCILLSIFTFTDFFYYIYIYQNNGKIFNIMFQKRIQDLFTENLAFLILTNIFLIENIIQTQKIDQTIIASQIMSFLSCFLVFLQIYFKRI